MCIREVIAPVLNTEPVQVIQPPRLTTSEFLVDPRIHRRGSLISDHRVAELLPEASEQPPDRRVVRAARLVSWSRVGEHEIKVCPGRKWGTHNNPSECDGLKLPATHGPPAKPRRRLSEQQTNRHARTRMPPLRSDRLLRGSPMEGRPDGSVPRSRRFDHGPTGTAWHSATGCGDHTASCSASPGHRRGCGIPRPPGQRGCPGSPRSPRSARWASGPG